MTRFKNPQILFLALALIALAGLVNAEVPNAINYQGRLTNSDGTVVDDGDYQIKFEIYGSEDGDDSFWSSGYQTVTVKDGLFSKHLGYNEVWPEETFTGNIRYLGITVGEDPEIYPRTQFTSVPWSLRVGTIDDASGGEIIGTVNISEDLQVLGTITGNGSGITNVDAALLYGIPGNEYVTFENMTQEVLGYDPAEPYPNFWQDDPDAVPISVTGAAGQIANLQEWKNNSGQVLASVGPSGVVKADGFKMPIDATDGYVLTSDGDGNGTWQAAAIMPKAVTGAVNGTTHGVSGEITVWFNPGHTDEFSSPPVVFAIAWDPANGNSKCATVTTTSLSSFDVQITQSVGGALVLSSSVDVQFMAIGH